MATSIDLGSREGSTSDSKFWSRDDTKFLISSPPLLLAAILCPKTQWHELARLINLIGNWEQGQQSPQWMVLCGRLGIKPERLREIISRSAANQTEHLIQVIHSLLWKNWHPRFEITGTQNLNESMTAGRGAVLWVAHFAFASLFTKMALSCAGYKVSHISRPEHGVSKSRFGIRFLNWFRCAAENRYLVSRIVHVRQEPAATKKAALEALRRNEFLSVTVGAWEGRHIATGELLGLNYTVSTGAPGFAFATGAKLLPVFTTRDNNRDCYCIAVGSPLGDSFRKSREEFIRASTSELFSQLERAIKEAPEQWRGWSKLSEQK